MSRINAIEQAIKQCSGGEFQKLFDAYLYKKYEFKNIVSLGSHDGTNNTTRGVPDSYVETEGDQYILIMYGKVETNQVGKLKTDIEACATICKNDKINHRVKKIICGHASSNITIKQKEELECIIPGITLELIGINCIAQDIYNFYPEIARDFLGIDLDTNQLFTINDFISFYDKNEMNAPLDIELFERDEQKKDIYNAVSENTAVILTGASGVGKTRLALEVCREYEKENRKVICIKSNELSAYEDIKIELSKAGEYLFFFDDANQTVQLNTILDLILLKCSNCDVKIILTSRDYAKDNVLRCIEKFTKYKEINIDNIKDEKIKEFLNKQYNIKNEQYLQQILKVAKGNMRLAVLAGKKALEKGYPAITNAEDIFQNYYGDIIKTTSLTDKELLALTIISFYGPIWISEDEIVQNIIMEKGISIEEFDTICRVLYEEELVDYFKNEIVKINDQSFGNYILFYGLIKKEYISIKYLLDKSFPEKKQRVIYSLNTITQLFGSEETVKYLKNQINQSWNNCASEFCDDYLECFGMINLEKTLAIIQNRLELIEKNTVKLEADNIKNSLNHNTVNCKEIELLSKYKYTECFEDAVELMLTYLDCNGEYFLDVYFSIKNNICYDKSSYSNNYSEELHFITTLEEYMERNNNINIELLAIFISKMFLECSRTYTEMVENYSFCVVPLSIIYCNGSRRLRSKIWDIVGSIYLKGRWDSLIEEEIFEENLVSCIDNEDALNFLKFDSEKIYDIFLKRGKNLTLKQCKILYSLENNMIYFGGEPDKYLKIYNQNEQFIKYKTLSDGVIKGTQFSVNAEWKTNIEKMTKHYSRQEFVELFSMCKDVERSFKNNQYYFIEGMNYVLLDNYDVNLEYYDIIDAYLLCGAPYGTNPDCIISQLLKKYGCDRTLSLIESHKFNYKDMWTISLLSQINAENINDDYINVLIECTNNQAEDKNPVFIQAKYLNKYVVKKPEILKIITLKVLENNSNIASSYFLDLARFEEDFDLYLEMYKNNISLLEELYLNSSNVNFDYKNKLLFKIVDYDFEFWRKYIKWICKNINHHMNLHKCKTLFNQVWEKNNYEKYINVAYDELDWIFEYFFSDVNDVSATVKCNRDKWIIQRIQKSADDDELRKISRIVVRFKDDEKMKYLLQIFDKNDDFVFFKTISLFKGDDSWSGSIIPLVDQQIDFIKKLKSNLKGIRYIKHRDYLNERIEKRVEYKKEEEKKEYMESYIYGNL